VTEPAKIGIGRMRIL